MEYVADHSFYRYDKLCNKVGKFSTKLVKIYCYKKTDHEIWAVEQEKIRVEKERIRREKEEREEKEAAERRAKQEAKDKKARNSKAKAAPKMPKMG